MNHKKIVEYLNKSISPKSYLLPKYYIPAAILAIVITTLICGTPVVKIFVVILIALYFFSTEKLPVDMTAMLIMIMLMILGLVTPSEGVSGFSNSATITVLCMFILSAGIAKTGIIHKLGNFVFRFAGKSEFRQITAISIMTAPLSGFINNTATVAIFLPMMINLANKAKTAATKILIPLSYISMLGGTLTVIGTSTNILANSILAENGVEPFEMFDFIHIGVIILIVGIIYFLLIGRHLLPNRKNDTKDIEEWTSEFLTELLIQKDSKFIGKTLSELKFANKFEANVIKIIRDKTSYIKNISEKTIEEGDILVILGNENRIIELDDRKSEKLLLNFDEDIRRMPFETGKIIKILLRDSRTFNGRSLEELDFMERFGVYVIGIYREDIKTQRLEDIELKNGEIILVKSSNTNLSTLRKSDDILILENIEDEFDPKKMWAALSIMIGVVALAAFGVMSIMVSSLLGVFLMFVSGCIKPDEIYHTVNWNVIFLLAGVIPLGLAMQNTGAADLIANSIVSVAYILPPIVLLGVFYLITTLLTEIISNNAAVVLLIPIALSVSAKLELNPLAFALIIMFAASTSFLSPVGYQTNTMVYGAGNYKFTDFIKVGAPLNLILLFLTTFLVAYFFGV